MPGYRTHLVGGIIACGLTGLCLASFLPDKTFSYGMLCITMSLIGSLFPDIDIASKMQRIFFIGSAWVVLFSLFTNRPVYLFITSFLVLMVMLLRHRTLTHNAIFIITAPILAVLTVGYLYKMPLDYLLISTIFFISGALSHIFLDRSQTKLKRLIKKRRF